VGYELCALVTRADALDDIGHDLRAVPLRQGFALIPITSEVFDELGGGLAEPFGDTFDFLSGGVRDLAVRLSAHHPVAYLEIDFFGGIGTQSSVVWSDQTVHAGPHSHDFNWHGFDRGEPDPPREQWPVNAALIALGATHHPSSDAFDALGLGRHRNTGQW